jgi:hypothetical protein
LILCRGHRCPCSSERCFALAFGVGRDTVGTNPVASGLSRIP